MELRPHHLLCIQGYHGEGYDQNFINNMNEVVQRLKCNPDQKIYLVCQCDDLCSACPEKAGSICTSQKMVSDLDEQTLKWLDQPEGEYNYSQLLRYIEEHLTWNDYAKICGKCEWYKKNTCDLKGKLVNKKFEYLNKI